MAPINVFIAYVDSFVGKHLLQQFDNKAHLFQVFGCTWEEEAAEAMVISMLERNQRQFSKESGASGSPLGVTGRSTASVLDPNAPNAPDHESAFSVADAPLPEAEETLPGTHLLKHNTRGPLIFWHRDADVMRKALYQCDWIIIEQRQSQDVLDILSYLQKQSFEKPKKLVLLSNFMTWYDTPPLSYPEPEDAEDAELEDGELESDGDINAPYPPPPDDEKFTPEDVEDAGDEEPEVPEGKEIFTEDQYNRRIPHVKYFNWRDAEKAVVAAHHAKGLPLDTFVVFAGLPYGNGEHFLQPFFRQAWSNEPSTLPIYGDGSQCIPMIHVRDLATFTRKLLRCPVEELPNPKVRYIFATDGASISWKEVMESVNKMFGNRMSLVNVPVKEFPLHNHVEYYTIDLRLDNSTIQTIMEREDPYGKEEGLIDGPVLHHDSNGMRDTWIAQGGIRKNSMKVALEFRHHNRVTPLRVALLGPPMSGKTYLSQKLATYYKLPHFSMDQVVEEFKQELQRLQSELAEYRTTLINSEKLRRLDIKKRRIIFANRKSEGAEDENDENIDGDDTKKTDAPPPIREESEDDVEEKEEKAFQLTEEEERDAEELMEDRFQTSERANYIRDQISRMERILLMRVRPRIPTPDANPKKRANATKKKLTKEQQRKKEEDELAQTKEALKDAPFQDRALALMMRWRLEKPDCRTQGYILDGFPHSVELAQLCFSSDDLQAPDTEEDALNPPPLPQKETSVGEDEEDSDVKVKEPSNEWRLPDFVIFLHADENYLLDRLTAKCRRDAEELTEPTSAVSTSPTAELGESSGLSILPRAEESRYLEKFHEGMELFQKQLFDSPYTLFNYFECAATVPEDVTVGGRHPSIHVVNVQDSEPLVPPPPPASQFELITPSEAEVAIHNILGRAHNFGKNPLEIHQEEMRRQYLKEEKLQQEVKEANEVLERERKAFLDESAARNQQKMQQLEIKRADYEELEKRKEPLREYLMKNILPLLSKGLLEVCALRPEEPVDYLAEWLLRHNPHDDVFSDL